MESIKQAVGGELSALLRMDRDLGAIAPMERVESLGPAIRLSKSIGA